MTLFFLTGCENKEEDDKNEYLAMKSSLIETKEYADLENMMCDIIVDIIRIDEEKVEYRVSLSNPKENMNDMKVLVVHNYYTEDVFPTIGLFDNTVDLLIDDNVKNIDDTADRDLDNDIELTGVIKTTNDIDELDLELKVLIEYIDDNGEKKDIYYKTTK